MLVPSFFGETLLDDFFGFPERKQYRPEKETLPIMQTDVQEQDNGYVLTMNLPGFKKEDVKAELKDGNLTISASTVSETSDSGEGQKEDGTKYLRRERFCGNCSRTFYVGKDVKQENIKARFEDGTLKLFIPKDIPVPEVEEAHSIAIEG